jgi:hypothetical protein
VKAILLALLGCGLAAAPAYAQTTDACPEDRFTGKLIARAECYYAAGDFQRTLTVLGTDATAAGKALRERTLRHVVVLRVDAARAGDPKELQVALDGAEPLAGETSSEIVLTKGDHAATVSRTGYQPWLLKLRYEPRDEPRAEDLLVLEVPALLPLSALGPRLNLRLEADSGTDARVTIDGKPASEATIAMGSHELRVEQPGRAAWGASLKLAADSSMPGAAPILTLSVPELEADAPPPAAPAAEAEVARSGGSWYLPAAASAAIISAVTSIVTLALGSSAGGDADDGLERHNDLVRAGASETEIALARDDTSRARGRRDAFLNASVLTAGAAVVFGGATLYFWATEPGAKQEPKEGGGPSARKPSQSPGSVGARASFVF